MPTPVHVRGDWSGDCLRRLSANGAAPAEARRLLAIAALLDGATRTDAARVGGMARQTLLDWVRRFNADGPEGLIGRKPTGRPAKLTLAQKRELASIVAEEARARASSTGRWRLADLTQEAKQRFDVEMDEVSVSRVLKRFGFRYDGVRWLAPHAGSKADEETTSGAAC